MRTERVPTSNRKLKQRAFLRHFRKLKNVALAAHRVGTSRTEIYRWARKYPDFKEAFDEEIEAMLDTAERELFRLGTGHYAKPVASGGKVVAHEEIRDTRALLAFLAAYRNRYKERVGVDLSGTVTQDVKIEKKIDVRFIAEVTRILAEVLDPTQPAAMQPDALTDAKLRLLPAAEEPV